MPGRFKSEEKNQNLGAGKGPFVFNCRPCSQQDYVFSRGHKKEEKHSKRTENLHYLFESTKKSRKSQHFSVLSYVSL